MADPALPHPFQSHDVIFCDTGYIFEFALHNSKQKSYYFNFTYITLYIDILSTNKRCSRKKCNREIPPLTLGSKAYNTCIGCQATIAASKAKAKQTWEKDGLVKGSQPLAEDGGSSEDNPTRMDAVDIRENISETTIPNVCRAAHHTVQYRPDYGPIPMPLSI